MILVDSPVPSAGLVFQSGQISDPTAAEALPGEEADLDFLLIQPTAMFGCVVNHQSAPQLPPWLRPEGIRERLAPVNVQVIHHHVNRLGPWIAAYQGLHDLRELRGRTVRRGPSEVPASFGLHRTENIRRVAALVFAVPLNGPARPESVGALWHAATPAYRPGKPAALWVRKTSRTRRARLPSW